VRRSAVFIAVLIAAIIGASTLYLVLTQRHGEVGRPVLAMGFRLTSTAFSEVGLIPSKYTCDGLDVSPPLRWEGYPLQTASFAIIMEDPDAPGGVFTHWLIYNIPPSLNKLDEDVPKSGELPFGALQGLNDFGGIGYGGPCPPPGKPHRYVFKIYALDSRLDLGPGATRSELMRAMEGHVVAEASLTGVYSR